jgi:hypothetical protein
MFGMLSAMPELNVLLRISVGVLVYSGALFIIKGVPIDSLRIIFTRTKPNLN